MGTSIDSVLEHLVWDPRTRSLNLQCEPWEGCQPKSAGVGVVDGVLCPATCMHSGKNWTTRRSVLHAPPLSSRQCDKKEKKDSCSTLSISCLILIGAFVRYNPLPPIPEIWLLNPMASDTKMGRHGWVREMAVFHVPAKLLFPKPLEVLCAYFRLCLVLLSHRVIFGKWAKLKKNTSKNFVWYFL